MYLEKSKIEKIIELRIKGNTIKGIARDLKISKNTSKRYIRLYERSESVSKFWESLIRPSKKLPKKSMSRHINSNRKVENRTKTEKEMAGKRAEFAFEKYSKMYKKSTKLEKGNLLDEFCKITKYHRKYASRLLKHGGVEKKNRKQREKKYSEKTIDAITRIWKAADHPWSERLVALIPIWLPLAKKHMKWITPDIEKQMLSISARQIDRRLKNQKKKLSRKLYGRTKPGKLLKHHIPIKTDNWDVTEPGFTEVDLVSHSGSNSSGEFIYSLNITDISTGWVETMPVMGKTEIATLNAIKEIRKELPFDLKGIDSDNGSEFINNLLFKYCEKNNIQFTRSRPYKKDDNAHIEQKNWTHVRRIMGYNRYDSAFELDLIKKLYRKKLRLMMNLFQPCVKLSEKVRIGSKVTRKYDSAKTPLDRLISHYSNNNITPPLKAQKLTVTRNSTDPFKLSKEIDSMIYKINNFKKNSKTNIKAKAI